MHDKQKTDKTVEGRVPVDGMMEQHETIMEENIRRSKTVGKRKKKIRLPLNSFISSAEGRKMRLYSARSVNH